MPSAERFFRGKVNCCLVGSFFVGNGLARSVGEAAFAETNIMKTAGYLKILAFSQCSGAVMPLRGRNEQARSLRKNCPLNNNLLS